MGYKTLRLAILAAIFCSISCRTPEDPDQNTDTDTETDPPSGPIQDISVVVHPQIHTLLTVHWTQNEAADSVFVEFSFENEEWLSSPESAGVLGAHSEILFGLPEATTATIRIVNETDGEVIKTETFEGTNLFAPADMPRPTLLEYNPTYASPHRWLLGTVENSPSTAGYWESPFFAYIIDRQARVVWYYTTPMEPRIMFPRIAPEGTYLYLDESDGLIFEGLPKTIRKTTLDLAYSEQIELEDMSFCYDLPDEGTILFDFFGIVKERDQSGDIRTVWDCQEWLPTSGWIGPPSDCFSNTLNYSPDRGSVLLSFPWDVNTVIEVNRESGEIMSNWGHLDGSWAFDPVDTHFDKQHFSNITEDGTLLLTSHVTGEEGAQRIMEFDIDDNNEVLTLIWSYGEGIDDFGDQAGEATRVAGGNTLINYGTGGVIREVTPDKQLAWHVVFDADFTPETSNKLIGHMILIDDLYELNIGP